MMTSNFPLLKLPLILLELIIDELYFIDLVQLSMKSTKLTGILQLLKLSVRFLNVRLARRSYGIEILQNCYLYYIDACDSIPVDTITEAVKIQGKPMQIWKDSRYELKVKADSAKMATLEAITKHVLSFSKVAKYSVTYNDADVEIRSLFVWKLTTQFYKFDIFPYNDSLVPISPEDLTFVLEGALIEDVFLNVSCPGFKYQGPIRCPAIHVNCPRWIDFDQFSLGPEAITANFSDQKVSNAVLNRLIKDWTEGKNPKLIEVKFTWNDNDPESLAMAQEHETRPPKPILPNRNIEQLKGLSINYSIKFQFRGQPVYYEVRLSVEEELSLNGIHLDDQA